MYPIQNSVNLAPSGSFCAIAQLLPDKMVKVVIPIPTISDRVGHKVFKVKRAQVKLAKLSKLSSRPKKLEGESWVVRYFKEFAANTALHGYNHIVREDSTKWER